MNARGVPLGCFHLGAIIEGKATAKDVELDHRRIAGRTTADDGLPACFRRSQDRHRRDLSRRLCAARLAELHRALPAARHHAVEPRHRPELRSAAHVRPAHDSLRHRRAAPRRHRPAPVVPALEFRDRVVGSGRRHLLARRAGPDAAELALRAGAVVDARPASPDAGRGRQRRLRRRRLCRADGSGRPFPRVRLRRRGLAQLDRRRHRHHRGRAVLAAGADAPPPPEAVDGDRAATGGHRARARRGVRRRRGATVPIVLRAVPARRLDGRAHRPRRRQRRYPRHPARPDPRHPAFPRRHVQRDVVPGSDARARHDRARRRRARDRAAAHAVAIKPTAGAAVARGQARQHGRACGRGRARAQSAADRRRHLYAPGR